ncbi:MAG: response regulator [Acidobacteriales bacterium]|nr:response regulator [Terriglobales bacterium]
MKNLLLVEDSKLIAIAAERLLTKAGFTVTLAKDGEEALKRAREGLPEVILLDMMLPKLSGEQVLLELKSDSKTAHIPVVILSSLSQQNEEKLKEAGAAAYVEKAKLLEGGNPAKLAQLVEAVIRESKAKG